MSMSNLIYEGVKRIDNWTRIKNEMPRSESVLKLSSDPVTIFQDIELSPQDRKMLSIIDGTKTIKDLINISWIGSFEAMKILYVLWSIGVLEEKVSEKIEEKVAEEEEPIPPEEILQPVPEEGEALIKKVDEIYVNLDSLSAYELLEVDENSDENTIKKQYYRLTREFHPDRYYGSADPSMKDKLTSIFDAITNAYDQLKKASKKKVVAKPEKKPEKKKEEVKNAPKAEEQFKLGIEALKKGDYSNAVEALKSATSLDPKQAKYWNYLSLSFTKIPDKIKDAEDALLEAITIDPSNADYYVNLGLIYLKSGNKQRARNQFEKALKFDPKSVKAKKGLEQTKEQKKK
jgi:tetratricopeptide (TPR) repeat protein